MATFDELNRMPKVKFCFYSDFTELAIKIQFFGNQSFNLNIANFILFLIKDRAPRSFIRISTQNNIIYNIKRG